MKTIFKKLTMGLLLMGVFSASVVAAGQSGCIACHTDDAKMKVLVTFIPPLEGEGEG